jgi:hypothetical protein
LVFRPRGKARLLTGWLLTLVPILLFAAMLAMMQWVAGMPVTRLWLRTILVFLATMVVVRLLPWERWIFRVRERTWLFWTALFALFVRHFVAILFREGQRTLTARRLSVPNGYGAGWFRSLAFALSAFLSRSLTRAERFYVAQLVRGIGE